MIKDVIVHIQDITICNEEKSYHIQGIWGDVSIIEIKNMESDLSLSRLKIPKCKDYMIDVRCKMKYNNKKRHWNYKILGYAMYNLYTKETSIVDKSIFDKFILKR